MYRQQMAGPHHLEGVLHRPRKPFVVSTRDRRNASVAAAHAVQDGLGIHLTKKASRHRSAAVARMVERVTGKAIGFIESLEGVKKEVA